MRWNAPCDSCSIRRVKCDRQEPCRTCRSRSQECTYLKVRRKPGPKGPRPLTNLKIREIQRDRYKSYIPAPTSGEAASTAKSSAIPLAVYIAQLDLFQARLYEVWPIISPEDLVARLAEDEPDLGSHALAAAACAATMAQLKLRPTLSDPAVTAEDFARECLRIRGKMNMNPEASLAALITSVFLHMYYANTGRTTAATLSLRESIAYADITNLCSDTSYDQYDVEERELRYRIYWVLFVTERTFCMQHGLPITLQKTTILPRPQTGDVVADDHAALYSLAKLFVHVQNPLLQLHSTLLELTPSAYSRTHILDVQQQMQMKNRKINRISESQCVDIVTTAAWIRSLLWQYSAAHFMLSSATETEPLSLDYPFIIARDFLESLSDISVDSICTHGYGMEIKLLQIANSLLDVLACDPDPSQRQLCYCGPLDAVSAIEKLLWNVGGPQSGRLAVLRERLCQIKPAVGLPRTIEWNIGNAAGFEIIGPFADKSSPEETQMGLMKSPSWVVEDTVRSTHGVLCAHRIEDLSSPLA